MCCALLSMDARANAQREREGGVCSSRRNECTEGWGRSAEGGVAYVKARAAAAAADRRETPPGSCSAPTQAERSSARIDVVGIFGILWYIGKCRRVKIQVGILIL